MSSFLQMTLMLYVGLCQQSGDSSTHSPVSNTTSEPMITTTSSNITSLSPDIHTDYLYLLFLLVIPLIIILYGLYCKCQYDNYKAFVVRKGLVLIIGISQFDDKKLFLSGVKQNVMDLVKLWNDKYNYDVYCCNADNVYSTKKDIVSFIDTHKNKIEHEHYQCVIVHIISHGTDGQFITSDGKQIKIEFICHELDWITNINYNSNLIKLVFVHGCRGKNDYSVEERLSLKRDIVSFIDTHTGIIHDSNLVVISGNISGPTLSDCGYFTECICESFGKNVERMIKSDFNALFMEIGNNLEDRTNHAEICNINGALLFDRIIFEKCKTVQNKHGKVNLDECSLMDIHENEYEVHHHIELPESQRVPMHAAIWNEQLISEMTSIVDEVLSEDTSSFAINCPNSGQTGSSASKTQINSSQKSNKTKNSNVLKTNNNYSSNGGGVGGSGGGKRDGDDEKKNDKYFYRDINSDDEEIEKKDNEDEKEQSDSFNSALDVDADEFVPYTMNSKIIKSETVKTKTKIKKTLETIVEDDDNKYNDMEVTNDYESHSNNACRYRCEPNAIYRAKGNVTIPKKLTDKLIPNTIKETLVNTYRYMNACYALQFQFANGRGVRKINHELRIITFDFHQKETNEILYNIMKPQKTGKRKWIMDQQLYTSHAIKAKFDVDDAGLPQSFRNSDEFQKQSNERINIDYIMESKQKLIQQIIRKTEWHKINVKMRITQQKEFNKKRLTLSFDPRFFKQTLSNYIMNNDKKLLEIIMFDKNKYRVVFVWIVRIIENIDIGILLTYNKKTDNIDFHGIHLDKKILLEQHQLIDPTHICQCLNDFKSNIDALIIGNIDEYLNKYKDCKQKLDATKQKLDEANSKNAELLQIIANLKEQLKSNTLPPTITPSPQSTSLSHTSSSSQNTINMVQQQSHSAPNVPSQQFVNDGYLYHYQTMPHWNNINRYNM